MKKLILLLLILPTTVMSQVQLLHEGNPQIHNVIFVVGDGMGVAQVYSSIIAQGADNSQFLRFPYTGFSRTYSYDKYTTDSGAGGTALMTGHKVENKHVGFGPNGEWYPSFLVKAKQQTGRKVGFVVTSSVLDATPASTYAHVPYRKQFDTISMQMAQCGFDVMIGGDRKHFLPENRKDGLAPLDTLAARGYNMAYSIDELAALHGGKVCALLSNADPLTEPSRGRMLSVGVSKALELLSRGNQGFVMMVEGSQIDWACHNNDTAYLAAEMADFEDALRIILDFAQRDGHTLVVVTADHETGGLTLPGGNVEQGINRMSFSTGSHTGVMVPVFSFGPGASQFTGIQQNIDIPRKIMKLLGILD